MRHKVWMMSSIAVLAGCGPTAPQVGSYSPFWGKDHPDTGQVIAQTALETNVFAHTLDQAPDDCGEIGLGVRVSSTFSDEALLFNDMGEPCKPAAVLFNGNLKMNQRAPAPGSDIKIGFHDTLADPATQIDAVFAGYSYLPLTLQQAATVENSAGALAAVPVPPVGGIGQNSAQFSLAPEAEPGLDLATTVRAWNQAQRQQSVLHKSDALLADIQVTPRTPTDIIEAHQLQIQYLMAELEATQNQVQQERVANQQLQDKVLVQPPQNQAELAALQAQIQQNEERSRTELRELRMRMQTLEQMNRHLAQKKAEKEVVYQQEISQLSEELAQFQQQSIFAQQAEKLQQELARQAAQKIAEAERIAFAARMAESTAMQREAQKKALESKLLEQRVADLRQGKTVYVPELTDLITDGVSLASLADAPVMVHLQDATLSEILENMLGSLELHIGRWQVDWRLDPRHAHILQETYSVNAEARFAEVLQYLQTLVQREHNIQLNFQQFTHGKRLVVSDQPLGS